MQITRQSRKIAARQPYPSTTTMYVDEEEDYQEPRQGSSVIRNQHYLSPQERDECFHYTTVANHRASRTQQRRASQPAYDTDADLEIQIPRYTEALTKQTLQRTPTRRMQLHPLLYIGLGMCSILLCLFIYANISAWYINSFYDPEHYIQTAHVDVANGIDQQGHKFQVRGFIDSTNHIDIVVLPEGQPNKARIFSGPEVTKIKNPQRAYINVIVQGSVVTIIALGPVSVEGVTTGREGEQWSTDLNQQSKGGK